MAHSDEWLETVGARQEQAVHARRRGRGCMGVGGAGGGDGRGAVES